MTDRIAVTVADHVAQVSLRQPTMPPDFFDEVGAVFRDLAERADLRAVVVRGSEKAFSYGLDLAAAAQTLGPAFAGGLAAQRTLLLATVRRWQAGFEAVARCPVPVIAAIHGWCIGGGLDLISACDLRLCSADARFSLRETRVAMVADLGSLQRLPAIIGPAATRELAFTGRDIDAERAGHIGLVSQVYPDREACFAAAAALAAEIARNAPLVVRGVKEVLDFGQGRSIAEGLAYVAAWNAAFLASEDLGEAMAAFAQKRTPQFKGR